MKFYKRIYACIILGIMFVFAIFNIVDQNKKIIDKVVTIKKPKNISEVQYYLSQIDGTLTDKIAGEIFMKKVYGEVYNALGKNEENDFRVVRDKDGFLYSGNFYNNTNIDADKLVRKIRKFKDSLPAKTKFSVLMFPTKYHESWSNGFYGIPYNDLNLYGDDVLRYMRRYDIDYLDYREVFLEEKRPLQESFYKTDIHWNNPTAFYSAGKFIDFLNTTFDAKLDLNRYYRNEENYDFEVVKRIYMGSLGRDAGEVYTGGSDDYTYIIPKFDTNYHYESKNSSGRKSERDGNVLNTLINKSYSDYKDVYLNEMSKTYLNGTANQDHIENKLLEKSEAPKILLLRDSFASPFAVFLSPMFREVDMLWSSKYTEDELEEFLDGKEYDYIVIALSVDNFRVEAFPFYTSEDDVRGDDQKAAGLGSQEDTADDAKK